MKLMELAALYLSRPGITATPQMWNHMSNAIAMLGDPDILDINNRMVRERFTDPRLEEVSPGTVRRELVTLQACINYGATLDVVERIHLFKPVVNDERVRWLTEEQRDAVLQLAWAPIKQVAAFQFYTGARIGEALAARWEQMVDGCFEFITRKGNGTERRRLVPIHPVLADILDEYPRHESLVLHNNGSPWQRWDLYHEWYDLMDVCRLEDFRLHDCRHTFCSILIRNGVDPLTVAKLSGHSQLSGLKRYVHLNVEGLAAAMKKL